MNMPASKASYLLLVIALIALGGCPLDISKQNGQTPSVPTGLTGLGLDGATQINWDTPATNVPHDLHWSTNGEPEQIIKNIRQPYFHQGLTNGQQYTYRLSARNTVGSSPLTAPITVTPVSFVWVESWAGRVSQGNFPSCRTDGTPDQCLLTTNNNSWITSRQFEGANINAVLDEPMTYIKLAKNFDMVANGQTFTMQDATGINMTVENLQPSTVEINNQNIPVTAHTELFIRTHEAILTDTLEYSFLELSPANFSAGDPCLGKKLLYVLATASDQAIANIPADSSLKIIKIDQIGLFFRRNILPDLNNCSDSAYAIGTIKLGIGGIQSDNNWARWDVIGILGPP